MLYQLEPGTRFQLHSHPYPELGLILSGEGLMIVGKDRRRAASGDSYYFPGLVEHGFIVPGDGDPVVLLDVSAVAGSQVPPSLEEMVGRLASADLDPATEWSTRGGPPPRPGAGAGRAPVEAPPAGRGRPARATAPRRPREPAP